MAEERSPLETLTQFTFRRIRNEIIEECAKAVDARIAHDDALPITDDETVACAAAVRSLKDWS